MNIHQERQKFLNRLMADLGTKNVSEAEKQKIVSLLSERFVDVAVETMISMANQQQRTVIDKVLDNPGVMEEELMKVAADIPGLSQAIEDAMLKEYELIKFAMNIGKE